MKPRLFIGSSVESLLVANAIHENLEHSIDCTIWSQGVFELSTSALDSLVKSAKTNFDAAVFVFAADDRAWIRNNEVSVTRDNVIFELGLFMGALGKERVFFVVPRNTPQLRLPTDLLGITPADYDPNRTDGNLQAALGPACNKIRVHLSKLSSKAPPTSQTAPIQPLSDETALSMITAWIDQSMVAVLLRPLQHAEIDHELGLPIGTSARLTKHAVQTSSHKLEVVADTGSVIQLRKKT
jgi:hypothetical protein